MRAASSKNETMSGNGGAQETTGAQAGNTVMLPLACLPAGLDEQPIESQATLENGAHSSGLNTPSPPPGRVSLNSSTNNKNLTTFKGPVLVKNTDSVTNKKRTLTNRHGKPPEGQQWNSLESISSKYSISSANDDVASLPNGQELQRQQQQQQYDESQQESDEVTQPVPLATFKVHDGAKIKNWQSTKDGCALPLEALEEQKTRKDPTTTTSSYFTINLHEIQAASEDLTHTKNFHLAHHDKFQSRQASSDVPPPPPSPQPASEDLGAGESSQNTLEPPFPFAGIIGGMAASFFSSLNVICVKLLPESDGFERESLALVVRGTVMSLLCAITIFCNGQSFRVPRSELVLNLLRCLFGCLGIIGSYTALKFISASDSTALIFMSPIWTSILSHFIFHEPLRWPHLVGLPASLFGLILIAHPSLIVDMDGQRPLFTPDISDQLALHVGINEKIGNNSGNFSAVAHSSSGQNVTYGELFDLADHRQAITEETADEPSRPRWPGVVMALSTSLCMSGAYIVLKFRRSTPVQTTTFWLGVSVALIAIPLSSGSEALEHAFAYTLSDMMLLVGIGISSWLNQSLQQWALLYEEAGRLSIVRTLDVALIFVLSVLLLDDAIYWTSVLGAALIGMVVVSVMLSGCLQKNSSSDDTSGEHEKCSKDCTLKCVNSSALKEQPAGEKSLNIPQPGQVYAVKT